MKAVFSFVCFLILMGCEPKDNKLSGTRGAAGPSTQNLNFLKVGSYGQPIFAAQNLEQVGSLVKNCLVSDDFTPEERVVRGQNVLIKNCNLRLKNNVATKALTSTLFEKWVISL